MVAVWILFVVGILAVIAGLIPSVLELAAYIYACVTSFKELLAKHLELRKEKIEAKKLAKLKFGKELEVKEDEIVAELPEDAKVAETIVAEEVKVVEPTPVAPSTEELAKDIVNSVL